MDDRPTQNNVHRPSVRRIMWKIPKGTKDVQGPEHAQLVRVTDILRREFERNGGIPLETPVFERSDVLLDKYGETGSDKLVYNITENGGENLTLRFDHTVPFVRHVRENGVRKMRRWTIGKSVSQGSTERQPRALP